MPRETVSLDKSLNEIGKDSLDAMTLVFELEDAFQVTLPDDCMDPTRSLRELAERVESLQAGTPFSPGNMKAWDALRVVSADTCRSRGTAAA